MITMQPRRRALTAALATAAALLAGCAAQPTHVPPHTHTVSIAHAAPKPIVFTAAGDSITAWTGRDNKPAPGETWPLFAQGGRLVFDGSGWARGGAKLAEIAANTRPIPAGETLVIMAGTNDLGDRWGTPINQREDEVVGIVNRSGAQHVVISAVAPFNMNPSWSNQWNVDLQALAQHEGWNWVDPWTQLRAADGRYVAGMTVEGIHPTEAGEQIVGKAMRDYLLNG